MEATAPTSNVPPRVALILSRELVAASDLVPAHQRPRDPRALLDLDLDVDSEIDLVLENTSSFSTPCSKEGAPSCASGVLRRSPSVGRDTMVMSLLEATGVLGWVKVLEPLKASAEDLLMFHDADYVEALLNWTEMTSELLARFHLHQDAQPFHGLSNHVFRVTGASLEASRALISGEYDIAINWTGGRHHAQRQRASGFCFVNDVVLSVLELQRKFSRVLSIDLDVHHGDGTESAFTYSSCVMTCSMHMYSPGFFPGTGAATDSGHGRGDGFCLNVPLAPGTTGKDFLLSLHTKVGEAFSAFHPQAVVLVLGADALAGDPRGGLQLDIDDLCAAASWVQAQALSHGAPLLVLGGGGYQFSKVARCWTKVTAQLAGRAQSLPKDIPEHEYFEEYGSESWVL
mmetsp:Transcript_11202/g.20699  ORF Transcript_11202/g.20699 Transcript_11202/m.20699 type:complete len:401 (+) Transcript_11202:157-1359(+)